eukprot:CAMPEP_0169197556 /NCGR_PEP_ID=MMETSP1016-20121227/8336_1 /TAXON_ID=342587 /ORGANISM="Karlodinium micrum, Strain CCMP2283" /LENGTH=112 /DNA_ID=CAMNT_0009274221 /DNA_START=253 /DNA_END=588 /DNA_ORIENTATION=-
MAQWFTAKTPLPDVRSCSTYSGWDDSKNGFLSNSRTPSTNALSCSSISLPVATSIFSSHLVQTEKLSWFSFPVITSMEPQPLGQQNLRTSETPPAAGELRTARVAERQKGKL